MNLAGFFMAIAGPVARKVMLALGIGFLTFQGVDVAVSGALNAAKSSFGGVTGDVAQLIAMSGINWAFGIIAGSITAGVTMMVFSRLAKLA